jgi:nucleoside-diphosphate-sugar epimerase
MHVSAGRELGSVRRLKVTILVTGGTGFIGAHAVSLLIERGHRAVALDNLSHGH